MMTLIFIAIILASALTATFVRHIRRAILALWVTSLGVGGLYLTMGAEFLAIIQWMISTLTTLSFIFFSVMFGEYNSATAKENRKDILRIGLAIALGVGFTAIIALGSRPLIEGLLLMPREDIDLSLLGKQLTEDHFLSLEVLALTLFLVLVGGGVIARSESEAV